MAKAYGLRTQQDQIPVHDFHCQGVCPGGGRGETTNSSTLGICAGRGFRQEGESEGTATHFKVSEDRMTPECKVRLSTPELSSPSVGGTRSGVGLVSKHPKRGTLIQTSKPETLPSFSTNWTSGCYLVSLNVVQLR